jgi:ankyrin repeat protein
LVLKESCTIKALQLLLEHGADTNFIGPDGSTPLLQVVASPHCRYEQLLLMLQHGGDLALIDWQGSSVMHHLIIRGKNDLLSRLFLEYALPTASLGSLHMPSAVGMTPLQLATALKAESPSHEHIEWMLAAAESVWQADIRPHLSESLSVVIPVKDLARLCCEYLDGSGRPWTIEEDAEMCADES